MSRDRILTHSLKVITVNENYNKAQDLVLEASYNLGMAIAELTIVINGSIGQSETMVNNLVSVNSINHETGEAILNFFPYSKEDATKRIEDLAIVYSIEESKIKIARKIDLGNGSNTIDGDLSEEYPEVVNELETILG